MSRSHINNLISTKLHFSVLLSLRSSQIDIDAEDNDGWTALHAAVYWGNMEVAEELVMHGASVNQKTKLVRHLYILKNNVICKIGDLYQLLYASHPYIL